MRRILPLCIAILAAACTADQMAIIEQLKVDVATAETATDRNQYVEAFMERVKSAGTPLIENDTTAVYIYQGPETRVQILGDLTQWSSNIEMEHIPGTDIHYYRGIHPAKARLEYLLVLDDKPPIPDPLCPYRILNGLGAHSELGMPGYTYHPALQETRTGEPGDYKRVTQHLLNAGIMGYPSKIYVYTPPEYHAGNKNYPTVYILDGQDYIEYGHMPHVLDWLIKSRQLAPVIAVFLAPPNRHLPNEPNRVTEYGMNPDYARFVSEEVAPFIQEHYRSLDYPSARLIAGPSFAGLASAYISFQHPDIFGLGYSQSGYLSFNGNALIEAYQKARSQPIRLYVDIGLYEQKVGQGWLPENEIDFLKANREFRKVLIEKGYDFIYREYPEGHTWGNWRAHLIEALIHYFPSSKT